MWSFQASPVPIKILSLDLSFWFLPPSLMDRVKYGGLWDRETGGGSIP